MLYLLLFVGIVLVVIQGACAYFDGYLTQAQMHAQGVLNGYSFMEHGGMWADVLVISPLVAYIATKYELKYTAWYSLLIFAIAVIATIAAGSATIKFFAVTRIGLMGCVLPHGHENVGARPHKHSLG
jgi:hypothetical protein